jgi:hypothetical protein
VGCFLIGKQKIVLFPTFRKNEGKWKLLGMLLDNRKPHMHSFKLTVELLSHSLI